LCRGLRGLRSSPPAGPSADAGTGADPGWLRWFFRRRRCPGPTWRGASPSAGPAAGTALKGAPPSVAELALRRTAEISARRAVKKVRLQGLGGRACPGHLPVHRAHTGSYEVVLRGAFGVSRVPRPWKPALLPTSDMIFA